MAPHIPLMRENVAKALCIDISQINIKATTEEGLGFTGNKEGISAQAVCLLMGVESMYERGVPVGGCGDCPHCSSPCED